MNARKLIHVLALVGLGIAAAWSIWGCLHASYVPSWQRVLGCIVAIGFWRFLFLKVWMEPKKWGLGVGIFLIVVSAFQTWLWIGAIGNPRIAELGIDLGMTAYALHELPLVAGGICCLLLRWFSPNDNPCSP